MLEVRDRNIQGEEPFGIWDTEKNEWVLHANGQLFTRANLEQANALLEALKRNRMKELVWNYYTDKSKFPRPTGMTDARLAKVKLTVMKFRSFWTDVIDCHGVLEYETPEEFHTHADKETFEHSLGNFHGMVMEAMLREGLIR